jgi:uncharacterized membrane protein
MSRDAKLILLPLILGFAFFCGHAPLMAGDVTLYTPYMEISVPPGETIKYTIDVINNGSVVRNVNLSLAGVPRGWDYELKAGGWEIEELSVLPGEKKNAILQIDVPLKVNKGTYHFRVMASGLYTLPLAVIVSEQGTFKTEFTTKQPNMEGNATSTFRFNADLKNRTAGTQLYALTAEVQRGWNVSFRATNKQVTSVQVDPNGTQIVTIEVDPPDAIEAGSYKIPVTATTSTTSASLELEVVITGSYGIELTTQTGLLSTDIAAGNEKRMEFIIRNKGSAELKDIKLNSSTPMNWEVMFDPKKVDKLEPGKVAEVYATIKTDKKAIAGDYMTTLEASTPETSSKAAVRVSVRTPMIWGWVGVFVIFGAVGSVYYMFRKYGRR